MSHFLKQRVKSFNNLTSLAKALTSIGGEQNVSLGRGQSLHAGGRESTVDLLCKHRGFKTYNDFGFEQTDGELLQMHCDSMDRNHILDIEQRAQTEYLKEETVETLTPMSFELQEENLGNQGQKQLVFSRWR